MYTAAMGFTSDACWFLLMKTLLIKNNKKREVALKNEAGGAEKRVFFYLALLAVIQRNVQGVLRLFSNHKHIPCSHFGEN